jgi:hypothetical protein
LKFIDYLYFNIYRWYYKMETDGRKVDPQNLTSMWFGICISGWCLFGNIIYSHYFQKNSAEFNKLILFFIAFTSYAIVNYIFSSNDRYLKVYNKYISSADNKSKGKLIFFSFAFMLLPYILIPFIFIFS